MRYPGGKNAAGVYQRIINEIPPHDVYIEPFLGSGAVLVRKRPARLSIAIERDKSTVREFYQSRRWPGRVVHLGPPVSMGLRNGSVWVILGDALEWLEGWCLLPRGSFIYADPPYVRSTRSQAKVYEHELDDGQHRRLLRCLRSCGANVLISGYPSALYEEELKGWRRIDYQAQTRGGPATECLWANYPPPTELHDYRYLGDDYRERERIAKKVRRWVARLERLPTLERKAILTAIRDGGLRRRDR